MQRRPTRARGLQGRDVGRAIDRAKEDLIVAINRLCESLFGAPETAPFAVDVDRYKDECGSDSAMTCEIAPRVRF